MSPVQVAVPTRSPDRSRITNLATADIRPGAADRESMPPETLHPSDIQAQNVQRFSAFTLEPHDPKDITPWSDAIIDGRRDQRVIRNNSQGKAIRNTGDTDDHASSGTSAIVSESAGAESKISEAHKTRALPPLRPRNDGFTFITTTNPSDFKSKNTMTKVRKKAMASFLRNDQGEKTSGRHKSVRTGKSTSAPESSGLDAPNGNLQSKSQRPSIPVISEEQHVQNSAGLQLEESEPEGDLTPWSKFRSVASSDYNGDHNHEASEIRRGRSRPTQGDLVLLRQMAPNRPDIAQVASSLGLESDSDYSSEEEAQPPEFVQKVGRTETQNLPKIHDVPVLEQATDHSQDLHTPQISPMGFQGSPKDQGSNPISYSGAQIPVQSVQMSLNSVSSENKAAEMQHELRHSSDQDWNSPQTSTMNDGLEGVLISSSARHDHSPIYNFIERSKPSIDDDTSSINSHYARSIISTFSVGSMASSATDLSRASGYSVTQIATASKELLSVFLQDPILSALFQKGIEDPGLGPERMRRNLRRLLKIYARELKEEASDALEVLAAQLVLLKIRSLTQAIIENFGNPESEEILNRSENSSGDEQAVGARPVDEDSFEDLVTFRQFLVESNAFTAFRDQLKAFVSHTTLLLTSAELLANSSRAKQVTPTVATGAHLDTSMPPTGNWELCFNQLSQLSQMPRRTVYICTGAVWAAFATTMIQFRVLEPILRPGWSRLRWKCSCGDVLFSDVREVRKGGIAALVAQMRRTSGVKVDVITHNNQTDNQQYRGQYHRHRGRFLHLAKLKSMNGISLTKLRLPIGGSVDVQDHSSHCTILPAGPTACECIPPLAKVEPSPTAEYQCVPGPPATQPPIPPQYFASLFTCPTDIHEEDTWILDQLPKRICGKLQGRIGQPAEGWGIYYEEGWDRDLIILVIFSLFLLGSLLFGILWSRYHFDVQGAFGVSAYMITASAGVMTVIVTRAEQW
ncbi:hypothetical protein NX059_005714 [Plenodomus lindquistii]|nr:hypothetical protein NX059_005714 [Plenodomus lindquistii]